MQCKRWKSTQVGVTLIREFFGVTVAEKAERGIFVTSRHVYVRRGRVRAGQAARADRRSASRRAD